MIVLDTIFPLFAVLGLGWVLRLKGMTTETFLKMADRLVYFIFFPAMLFWKIGSAPPDLGVDPGLCGAALLTIGICFFASLWALRAFGITPFQAGSFCQAAFRFNTYIGLAIVFQVLGDEGIRHFGLLAGIVIPVINVLCVSVLIWYSGREMGLGQKIFFFVKELATNPLILSCAAGFLFSRAGLFFPTFIHNSFSLLTSATLPLALLSIGGQLKFHGMGSHAKASFVAAGLKLVLMPLVGGLFLKLFGVSGVPYMVGMIFFTLPTSSAIHVLSSQLSSDTDLAAVAVVVSTLGSFVSLSLALML